MIHWLMTNWYAVVGLVVLAVLVMLMWPRVRKGDHESAVAQTLKVCRKNLSGNVVAAMEKHLKNLPLRKRLAAVSARYRALKDLEATVLMLLHNHYNVTPDVGVMSDFQVAAAQMPPGTLEEAVAELEESEHKLRIRICADRYKDIPGEVRKAQVELRILLHNVGLPSAAVSALLENMAECLTACMAKRYADPEKAELKTALSPFFERYLDGGDALVGVLNDLPHTDPQQVQNMANLGEMVRQYVHIWTNARTAGQRLMTLVPGLTNRVHVLLFQPVLATIGDVQQMLLNDLLAANNQEGIEAQVQCRNALAGFVTALHDLAKAQELVHSYNPPLAALLPMA